jgi:hypothetical protein
MGTHEYRAQISVRILNKIMNPQNIVTVYKSVGHKTTLENFLFLPKMNIQITYKPRLLFTSHMYPAHVHLNVYVHLFFAVRFTRGPTCKLTKFSPTAK